MKMSTALQIVKMHVELPGALDDSLLKTSFICIAAGVARKAGRINERTCRQVTNMIQQRLGHNGSVESWIYDNVLSPNTTMLMRMNKMLYQQRCNQYQAYRHRWLDALIEEFKAKGD